MFAMLIRPAPLMDIRSSMVTSAYAALLRIAAIAPARRARVGIVRIETSVASPGAGAVIDAIRRSFLPFLQSRAQYTPVHRGKPPGFNLITIVPVAIAGRLGQVSPYCQA